MQLLQDTFIIEQLQVLSEGKDKGKMKIKGVFGRCNEKNNNGRIYPTAVLEAQLAKVQPMIAERRLCGELDHPQNDTVKLSNASHLITKLDMKGNELIGEAEILNTPAGLTAAALVNGGVKIGISSRGMGTLSEDHNGDKVVNEDFRLVTFDLVADPSTRGAYPGLSESTESKYVRETQSKLTKESNFITMLESKMKDAYDPYIEEEISGEEARATIEKSLGSKKVRAKRSKAIEKSLGSKEVRAKRSKALRPTGTALELEAFELVKADGHWHRIADAIAEGFGKKIVGEAFETETEAEKLEKAKEKITSQPTGSGKSAPGLMDRWRIKAGKRAEAQGDVQASRIRKRGEAGGSVGLAGKFGIGAGSERYSNKSKAMLRTKAGLDKPEEKPGVLDRIKSKFSSTPQKEEPKPAAADPKPADIPQAKRGQQGMVPGTLRDKDSKSKVKPKMSDEDKYSAKVAGKEQLRRDTASVRAGAKSDSAGKTGEFGSGVKSKEDKDIAAKAIARRERKTGKKVNLTPQQKINLAHTSYKQIGNMLAEMFKN